MRVMGWDQTATAKALRYTQPHISAIVNGKVEPPDAMLEHFKLVVGVRHPDLVASAVAEPRVQYKADQLAESLQKLKSADPDAHRAMLLIAGRLVASSSTKDLVEFALGAAQEGAAHQHGSAHARGERSATGQDKKPASGQR